MVLFLIQCTAKPGVVVKEDENQTLRNRAGEYWNLMINLNPKNAEKLYGYEAPTFREKVPFVEYTNRFSNKYLEANVQGIKSRDRRGM